MKKLLLTLLAVLILSIGCTQGSVPGSTENAGENTSEPSYASSTEPLHPDMTPATSKLKGYIEDYNAELAYNYNGQIAVLGETVYLSIPKSAEDPASLTAYSMNDRSEKRVLQGEFGYLRSHEDRLYFIEYRSESDYYDGGVLRRLDPAGGTETVVDSGVLRYAFSDRYLYTCGVTDDKLSLTTYDRRTLERIGSLSLLTFTTIVVPGSDTVYFRHYGDADAALYAISGSGEPEYVSSDPGWPIASKDGMLLMGSDRSIDLFDPSSGELKTYRSIPDAFALYSNPQLDGTDLYYVLHDQEIRDFGVLRADGSAEKLGDNVLWFVLVGDRLIGLRNVSGKYEWIDNGPDMFEQSVGPYEIVDISVGN